MEEDDDFRRLVRELVNKETANRQQAKRLELEMERSQIDERARLRDGQIKANRATIQNHRVIIEQHLAAIRAAEESDIADKKRREEISRILDTGMKEERRQMRAQLQAETLSIFRSQSLDPASRNQTPEPSSTSITQREQRPPLDGIAEDSAEGEQDPDVRPRRSTRKRTMRHYREAGLPQAQTSNKENRDPGVRKRRRLAENDNRSGASKKKSKATSCASTSTAQQNTIEYDEVYANGNAEIKYTIVEYPKNSNDWFILRCLEHNKHFARNPLQGGAKHLESKWHNRPRHWNLAFEMFHVRVLNCNAAKAEQNNEAVKKAGEAGNASRHDDASSQHSGQSRQQGDVPATTITDGSTSPPPQQDLRSARIENLKSKRKCPTTGLNC